MDPSVLVLVSEAILSLYPILIRTVPTTLTTQWFARFLTFPVLAYIFSSSRDLPSLSSLLFRPSTLLAGLLNLVLAGWVFFGEEITAGMLFLLALAMVGVGLVAKESLASGRGGEGGEGGEERGGPKGIIAALLAALTETLLYVFVRWTSTPTTASPFRAILQLYPLGLLVLLFAIGLSPATLDITPSTLLTLFGFNALVGFTGYAARFYAIPRVSTFVFSLLSFVGVLFGYVWGHWFTSDKTTPLSWLGSGLIAVTAFMVRYQKDPRHE
jgi:drug/metabolite transporter (DMT)-like permease